jgi:RNA polymerase sigma-70 factor (ECF subfamily)
MAPSPEEQTALEEAQLLAQIATGDRAAFRQLYDRYSGPLFSLAVRMTGDTGAAEELLQDVFLKIWRHAAAFEAGKSHPFTWAITITRRTCIVHILRRRYRPALIGSDELLSVAAADSVHRAAETSDQVAQLHTALTTLPADQRRVLELALFSEFTHAEIAAHLRAPIGTVKTWIRRGLLALRASLPSVAP